ncbi:hypothetical protein M0657_000194 [Pyricularia oryzae]|uniref:Uncharacterized protein n=1 Tax=Pyricularia oryzae TaxID=318829 RepID=A0A4P7N818_PYROR|nr:hypothetical protein MCOR17_003268 [Pyricularia oryzae]KAI7931727.1 hypothetical protein M9X92_000045 [Pyricularia oryzae]KAI7932885.1 hypothetical protein M0657_000194 [Pyricularia oryzae]QBZ56234.1 hypothetical protein PoMZ_01140 [Pyricularia oryzae]
MDNIVVLASGTSCRNYWIDTRLNLAAMIGSMDAAPLIKAHDHARNAALAHTDTTVAINEHALAAGEFSNAARSTTSAEALRTLKLLEQHHQRLSDLLKLPLERPPRRSQADDYRSGADASHNDDVSEKPSARPASSGADDKSTADDMSSRRKSAVASGTTSSQQRRYPPSRELSSSIASNLASARGIRSSHRGHPLAPSVSNDQAPGSLDGHPSRDVGRSKMQNMLGQKPKPSWVPPTEGPQKSEKGQARQQAERPAEESNEDGYSRFYSTFGSLIKGLSAPLAFAGLPLIAEESAPEPPTSPDPAATKKSRPSRAQHVAPEPDLARIYSKATLQALGHKGHAPNDSFYFVPATGGTVSYANILSFDQKERRRNLASIHDGHDHPEMSPEDAADEDDFVDARESQASSSMSPGVKRRIGSSKSTSDLQNVVEELYLENKGLKEMLDKLSKRLHAFEANAQNYALQSSMRLVRPGSPLSSSGGGGGGSGGDEGLRRRNQELEQELAAAVKRMEALEKEYMHVRKVNGQYRERWEKLKAGAKARREAQVASGEGESSRSQAG